MRANAREPGIELGDAFYSQLLENTPQCSKHLTSILPALRPAYAMWTVIPATIITDQFDDIANQIVADSITGAGVSALSNIDLSSTGFSLSDVQTAIDAYTVGGLGTIDEAMLAAGKDQLKSAYSAEFSYWASQGIYQTSVFAGMGAYAWRWPTSTEVWGFVGAGCTVAVAGAMQSGAVGAAVRTMARAGAVVGAEAGGVGAIPGALLGGAIGGAGAVAGSCAAGAAGGAVALIGMIASE